MGSIRNWYNFLSDILLYDLSKNPVLLTGFFDLMINDTFIGNKLMEDQ